MADDNKINYDSELTSEEKAEIQEALKNLNDEDIQNDEDFIKDIYGQADTDMSKVYEENKKNKESILDKISKVLLYYTIADNVLKISNGEYKSLFLNFSKTIVDMFKNHSELTQNVMEDTLNNAAKKVVDKYNLKKNQKQREKLVNEKYYGQHFSERIWDNEQEVAKQIQLEIKNLLLGKVSANQIAKNIKIRFDSNDYDAKRLADTEISRIQNELFRQKCNETGAKYVLYKATFCRTCKTCKTHHNIIYKVDYAPLIPLHPNCHCYYSIVTNLKDTIHSEQMDIKNFISNIASGGKEGHIRFDKLPKEYYKNLSNLIDAAPNILKKNIVKFKDDIVFGDIQKKTTPNFYSPSKGKIFMNLERDSKNPRGAYVTFSHELGHYIDNKLGNPSIKNAKFSKYIKEDLDKFIESYAKANNIYDYQSLKEKLSESLKGDDRLHSISDLIGGYTQNQITGKYTHSIEYWENPKKLPKEAFAHFHEATLRNDEFKLQLIQSIFPKSYKEFLKMLEA